MKKSLKKVIGMVTTFTVALSAAAAVPVNDADIQAASYSIVEKLDRGISAVNTDSGMLVNWRYLANDDANAVFKLYRDNNLVYTSQAGEATCYLDAEGTGSSDYKLETRVNGTVISTDTCSMISGNSYFDIPLDQPSSIYTPNDCSVGDVDGDGQYELFVKWDPNTSKDNSIKGLTDPCIIDCYTLEGTKLWRINIGTNIRSGAHYTQFFVGDFDLDGKAEMTCKTADGTVDGLGNVIGDPSADYCDNSGLIYSGPEYYTLFDGETGEALDTIDYEPGRGDPTKWGKSGDKYNRVERYWGVVAYLDGVTPCVVTGRGYYGRMTATAYTVVNDKLVKLWMFDTGTSSSTLGYGDGNHNSMPADVDGDGKQEIITGSTCIDDDGTLLWCTNQGHGDAMHVGDLDPDNPGTEVWICHEDSPFGVTLVDGDNGKILFHYDGSNDTGRCCAGNVWTGNDGAEFWGLNNDVYNSAGTLLSCNRPAINFLSYWDGDLEREILDGYTDSPATIKKMNANGKLTQLLSTDGYYTCNTTKGTPCLSADIFGDWREELIVRAADGKSVRIYATTYDTDYRIQTLMHDPQYRNQVASQQVAYNQPPHPSFYLGSERALPEMQKVTVSQGAVPVEPISAYETIEAENYNYESGTKTEDLSGGGQNLGFIENGDYIGFKNIGFGDDGALSFIPKISGNTCFIEIYLDSLSSNPVAKCKYNGSGSFSNYEETVINIPKITGTHIVYLKFTGGEGYLLNIDSFKFGKTAAEISGRYVNKLQVTDTANISGWGIDTALALNDVIYGDRDFTFTAIPDYLIGGELINTACDSKSATTDTASFIAAEDMTLYIGVDNRVTAIPSWLSDYTLTEDTMTSSNTVTYVVYKKDFAKGDTVILGANGQSSGCVNYTAIAAGISDDKPVVNGDTNADLVTNETDAVNIKDFLIRKTQMTDGLIYDVNNDSKINVFDWIFVKNNFT